MDIDNIGLSFYQTKITNMYLNLFFSLLLENYINEIKVYI